MMTHDKYDISDPVHLAEIEDHGIVAISRRRDESLTAGLIGSAIAAGCEIRTDRNFVGPLRNLEIMSTRCEICEVYLSDTLYPDIIQWAEDRALWFEGRRFRYAYDRENFERGIAYGYAKPAEASLSSASNH